MTGAPQTSSVAGLVNWSDGEASVQTAVTGDLVTVANKATGNAAATGLFPLQPGGQVSWNASANEHEDSQVNAFVATMIAKNYVRTYVDAAMPTLDEQMTGTVSVQTTGDAFNRIAVTQTRTRRREPGGDVPVQ